MLKSIAAAAMAALILGGLMVAPASAQDANQCVQAAYDLAQTVEGKQLGNDRLDKIEDLLNKMEDLCDSDKVAEAMDIAKDIEAEMNAE